MSTCKSPWEAPSLFGPSGQRFEVRCRGWEVEILGANSSHRVNPRDIDVRCNVKTIGYTWYTICVYYWDLRYHGTLELLLIFLSDELVEPAEQLVMPFNAVSYLGWRDKGREIREYAPVTVVLDPMVFIRENNQTARNFASVAWHVNVRK